MKKVNENLMFESNLYSPTHFSAARPDDRQLQASPLPLAMYECADCHRASAHEEYYVKNLLELISGAAEKSGIE